MVYPIEVASVINREGLARAGSWFIYQIYLSAIDTIVTGMTLTAEWTAEQPEKTEPCCCARGGHMMQPGQIYPREKDAKTKALSVFVCFCSLEFALQEH